MTHISAGPIPVSPPPRVFYSVPEAASATSLSRREIYRLLDCGELKSVRYGRRRLIVADSLHEFAVTAQKAAKAKEVLDGDPLELLTFADLAELWKTGEDWLRKAVSARTVPHTRVAGQIRFTRAQAAEILASHAAAIAQVPTRGQVAARRAHDGREL